jgi:hypothetical protein
MMHLVLKTLKIKIFIIVLNTKCVYRQSTLIDINLMLKIDKNLKFYGLVNYDRNTKF